MTQFNSHYNEGVFLIQKILKLQINFFRQGAFGKVLVNSNKERSNMHPKLWIPKKN